MNSGKLVWTWHRIQKTNMSEPMVEKHVESTLDSRNMTILTLSLAGDINVLVLLLVLIVIDRPTLLQLQA